MIPPPQRASSNATTFSGIADTCRVSPDRAETAARVTRTRDFGLGRHHLHELKPGQRGASEELAQKTGKRHHGPSASECDQDGIVQH